MIGPRSKVSGHSFFSISSFYDITLILLAMNLHDQRSADGAVEEGF
jgi:hypothetical protein